MSTNEIEPQEDDNSQYSPEELKEIYEDEDCELYLEIMEGFEKEAKPFFKKALTKYWKLYNEKAHNKVSLRKFKESFYESLMDIAERI